MVVRHRSWPRCAAVLFCAMLLSPANARAAERVRLDTRPGVKVNLYVEVASAAKATLILLPGGKGRVKVDKNAHIGNADNFVVRGRGLFVAAGYNVILPDAPSDQKKEGLGGEGDSSFRLTGEHVTDLAKIVDFARGRFGGPVVIVGMSRGSISLAALLKARPGIVDAAVFTASVISGNLGGSLHKTDLSAVAGPVLFIHHRNDACKVSRPKNLQQAIGGFTATEPALILIDGTGPAQGTECGPYHYHGFEGQEAEAVAAIDGWVAQALGLSR